MVGERGLSRRWRRAGVAILALAAALAALAVGGCGPLTGVLGISERPNVVLILTDDQDVGSVRYMPNVERLLAEEGTTFENAFVTDALCCPSRATILRGQYAHNHGVAGNAPPRGGHERFKELGHEESTIATWLQDDGYETALVGKYLNNYTDAGVPPGWEEWRAISGSHRSHDLNENGRIVTYDPERHHLDDVLAEKAAGYAEDAADEGTPFFMWVGTKAPHLPATPAPRHRDDFAGVPLPEGPSFDEADVSDKPRWIRDNPPLGEGEISRLEELHHDRLRSLRAVDEMVVRLVRSLREAGELDNTFIFFMSDNGFHAGQHRLGTGKWTAYEEDVRVPLIVRGPGVPAGETREHLALNNDIAPTLADIAGTQAPPFVDGRSLMPLLSEEPPPEERWRQAFLVEAAAETPWTAGPPYPQGGSQEMPVSGDAPPEGWRRPSEGPVGDWGRPALEAVRTEDYLYAEYEGGDRELYDLRKDPHQLENLLGESGGGPGADSALVGRLEEGLEERLAVLRGCAGAECRAAEDAMR
jgi:N-acetylglucosamine-6-sulfatase